MIKEAVQQKTSRLIQVFSEMSQQLKWSDNRILMMAASVYVVNNAPFNVTRFKEISDYIKTESGMFSHLKSSIRFTVAAMLDAHFDNPKEVFHDFVEVYEKLISSGFKRNNFTYISALAVIQNQADVQNVDERIKRSLSIYKSMKSEHPFITTSDDYPLAVILAGQEGEIDHLVERMELFYRDLNEKGFRKGNHLQFLSHILSLDTDHAPSLLIDRTIHISDTLKRFDMKPKTMHYPDIGILALMEQAANEFETLRSVKDQLDHEKHFKWHKDINYKLAVQLLVSEKISGDSMLETGLFTSMEVIMQAQQAAVFAGTSGAVAASGGGE